jgi:hypothetical protein
LGRKRKFTKEVLLQAIVIISWGKKSIKPISNDLACDKKTVIHWIKSFDSLGEVALLESNRKKSYSKEFKEQSSATT